MADYKPQALDVRDVGATAMGSPARAAMYAGVARRNPALLGGFAAAEGHTLRDLTNRAYSENADVNQMLNELAQSDQWNEARKNEIDLFKSGIQGYAAPGYRRSIGDIFTQAGYGDLGGALYEQGTIGDQANLEGIDALSYNRRATGDAARTNAAANRDRVSLSKGPKTKWSYDTLGQIVPTYEASGILDLNDIAALGAPGQNVTGEGGQGMQAQMPGGVATAPELEEPNVGSTGDFIEDRKMARQTSGMTLQREIESVDEATGKPYTVLIYQDANGKTFAEAIDPETGERLE